MHADKRLARFRLAIGEVVGHLALNVIPLTSKVPLGFEYCAADQSVGAALHLDALLEANIGQRNVELGH
jgi:hypothetical protein